MRQDRLVSPVLRPPSSLLLLVGREDFAPPSSFGGRVCAATADCVAVAVRSVVDGPTTASIVPSADVSQLQDLGEFTLESEGQVSLRDLHFREHDAIGVDPGLVHVRVWGNHDSEPDEIVFVVRPQ